MKIHDLCLLFLLAASAAGSYQGEQPAELDKPVNELNIEQRAEAVLSEIERAELPELGLILKSRGEKTESASCGAIPVFAVETPPETERDKKVEALKTPLECSSVDLQLQAKEKQKGNFITVDREDTTRWSPVVPGGESTYRLQRVAHWRKTCNKVVHSICHWL
jgi:hypothetical protein